MTEADRQALSRLVGTDGSPRASTDELQGLLLQVVFALLMIFMIAYFIFVGDQKKTREEEVLALNRQKLVLALDKVAEDRRIRYGLNALMTQGTDGSRSFDPSSFVRDGKLELVPAAQAAFSSGSRAAATDYTDRDALAAAWRADVLDSAGLTDADLAAGEGDWLATRVAEDAESVRRDARGVQRALAARLLKQWVENPSELSETADALELARLLREKSLRLVSETIDAPMLP